MIDESKEAKRVNHNGNLLSCVDDDPQSGNSSDKSPGNEYKKRFGFKTAATASRFAAKISPKSVRKRAKYKPVLCNVKLYNFIGLYSACTIRIFRCFRLNWKQNRNITNLKSGYTLSNFTEEKRLAKTPRMKVELLGTLRLVAQTFIN